MIETHKYSDVIHNTKNFTIVKIHKDVFANSQLKYYAKYVRKPAIKHLIKGSIFDDKVLIIINKKRNDLMFFDPRKEWCFSFIKNFIENDEEIHQIILEETMLVINEMKNVVFSTEVTTESFFNKDTKMSFLLSTYEPEFIINYSVIGVFTELMLNFKMNINIINKFNNLTSLKIIDTRNNIFESIDFSKLQTLKHISIRVNTEEISINDAIEKLKYYLPNIEVIKVNHKSIIVNKLTEFPKYIDLGKHGIYGEFDYYGDLHINVVSDVDKLKNIKKIYGSLYLNMLPSTLYNLKEVTDIISIDNGYSSTNQKILHSLIDGQNIKYKAIEYRDET